jgi:hypothetical protein
VLYEFWVTKRTIITSPQRLSKRTYKCLENPIFDKDLLATFYRHPVNISNVSIYPKQTEKGIPCWGRLHFTMDVSVDFVNILAKIPVRNELFAKEARNLPGELSAQLVIFL